MPEHADDERLSRILEPLDRAVVGPRDLAQPFADPPDALVVVRLHRRRATCADAGGRIDAHRVLGERAVDLAVLLVPDDLGQVLDEVAAARDVQHLEAAADREHRHVARERGLEQRELAAVALGVRSVRLRMRLGAVLLRIEVVAAGEEQAVERVERLLDAVLARRHEHRAAAGALDRAHVVVRDRARPRACQCPHAAGST